MQSKNMKTDRRGIGIYMLNVLSRTLQIPFNDIGNNIGEIIQNSLVDDFEGKCLKEGYIKKNSIRVINYSSGRILENKVVFTVNFECLVCRPVEGMNIRVTVKNVTKAGLRCETKDDPSPVIVFVARDHHYKNKNFSKLNVDDDITVKVAGIRYELNDKYIAIIGELVNKKIKKPKIIIARPKQ